MPLSDLYLMTVLTPCTAFGDCSGKGCRCQEEDDESQARQSHQ